MSAAWEKPRRENFVGGVGRHVAAKNMRCARALLPEGNGNGLEPDTFRKVARGFSR